MMQTGVRTGNRIHHGELTGVARRMLVADLLSSIRLT
jgi:hypothetical protein